VQVVPRYLPLGRKEREKRLDGEGRLKRSQSGSSCPLTPRLEEMAEHFAHPNANRENWLERSPMEEEGSGVR
jgi:hypothetical protein